MSTNAQQDAVDDGGRPVWDRRVISRVRRELRQHYLLVQSAHSFASVSTEQSVFARYNRKADDFYDLVNKKIADYNACTIETVAAEEAANDLIVEIDQYRKELETVLQPMYMEEDGSGHREVSFDAGSPIEKKAAPVDPTTTDNRENVTGRGNATLNKTLRVIDDDDSETDEEIAGGKEATEAGKESDGAGENQGGADTTQTGGLMGRIAGLFRNSTPTSTPTTEQNTATAPDSSAPTEKAPAVDENVTPPIPAEKERSHTRSAASIARSLQAKKERDEEKKKELKGV